MSSVLDVFKKRIKGVHTALGNLNEPAPRVTMREDYAFDYAEGRQKYLNEALKKSVKDLKDVVWELVALRNASKANEPVILKIILTANEMDPAASPEIITQKIKEIEKEVALLKGSAPSPSELNLKIPRMPDEVKGEISADLKEAQKCFEAQCYRSCVVLCGRIMETTLHRKFYEATATDLLETNPGIGLGKLIAKLRENNVSFDPGITQQIHLINQVRVYSVHQKNDAFEPSKAQAHAMILYTLDVLEKMF